MQKVDTTLLIKAKNLSVGNRVMFLKKHDQKLRYWLLKVLWAVFEDNNRNMKGFDCSTVSFDGNIGLVTSPTQRRNCENKLQQDGQLVI